jgi:predicted O-linked N-acetylglucosamine transferase (SPINDLY family)
MFHAPQAPGSDVQHLLEEALVLFRGGRHRPAEDRIAEALQLEPHSIDALNLLGVVRNAAGRPAEALVPLETATRLAPGNPGVLANLGMVLRALGRLPEALNAYDRVLALDPGFAPAHANRAAVLFDLNRLEDALVGYDTALRVRPDHAETLYRRGLVLRSLGRPSDAVASFDRALALRPGLTDALVARGDVRRQNGEAAMALADYRAALSQRPADPNLPSLILRQQLKLCDWTDYVAQRAALDRGVIEGTMLPPAFPSLSLLDRPDLQLSAARAWGASLMGTAAPPMVAQRHDGPIRLGYFSADFHAGHPTLLLMAQMLERHDRSRFHVTGFHFSMPADSVDPALLGGLFDDVVGLDGQSDGDAAALARSRGIDIAIDVDGYTRGSRPRIFAQRAAPVQVSYLAYAGTLGVGHIDYLLADTTLIGPEDAGHYSEKIAWLPHSYQPRDTRIVPTETPTRAAAGLPEQGFVFCCFNASYKITPHAFADWMKILNGVPGSVLWLLDDQTQVMANLRQAAAAEGIAPERLIFAGHAPLQRHLARLRLAGLVLDTLPYNAHTTASDALFVGVPMLTRPGRTFASRVGASLLTTLGLPELIAETRTDYVERAVAIGNDPALVKALRDKLADQAASSPLFDMERYTRDLEAAYTAMIARAWAGQPAESFRVSRD